MPETTFDVVVAGHVCLDVIPRFGHSGTSELAQMLVPGKLVHVDAAAVATGGPVSNTGLGLVKLGMRAALMGKVGDDFFGRGLREIFARWGAGEALTVSEDEATSYTVVLAPPGVDRIFLHHPGCNDTFGADDVRYDLVAQARLFHLGYPPLMRSLYVDGGTALVDIYRRVKDLGITTSLDMALPDPDSEAGAADWDGILTAVLPYVDIAPLSAEESMYMLDRRRFDQIKQTAGDADALDAYTTDDLCRLGREILRRGAAIAAIKCGRRGMLLFTHDADRLAAMGTAAPRQPAGWSSRRLWAEAFLVESVASATGSGDSSIAGLLAAFLRGGSPEQVLSVACCVGGQNVQVLDAVSGIHTWEQTAAMLDTWPKRRQDPGPGWSYDEIARIWRGPDEGGV